MYKKCGLFTQCTFTYFFPPASPEPLSLTTHAPVYTSPKPSSPSTHSLTLCLPDAPCPPHCTLAHALHSLSSKSPRLSTYAPPCLSFPIPPSLPPCLSLPQANVTVYLRPALSFPDAPSPSQLTSSQSLPSSSFRHYPLTHATPCLSLLPRVTVHALTPLSLSSPGLDIGMSGSLDRQSPLSVAPDTVSLLSPAPSFTANGGPASPRCVQFSRVCSCAGLVILPASIYYSKPFQREYSELVSYSLGTGVGMGVGVGGCLGVGMAVTGCMGVLFYVM